VEGYSTDIFADAANDFIRRQGNRPWFVYVPFNAAHFNNAGNVGPGVKPEWQAPAKYFERYGWAANEPDEKRRYQVVLTALDDAIGRILDQLDALKLRERTIVMLISDNGAFMLPGRGLEVASNAPLRDGGTTCYEGGTRVPAIFRWPGHIKAGSEVRGMLSHLDVLPLCLSVSGAGEMRGRVIDGRNPMPVLTGAAPAVHERLAFAYDKGTALRDGALKIVRHDATRPWELYDLANDVGEAKNLASSRPAEVARLDTAFQAWTADVKRDASPPARRPVRAKK
jgi:arylsulfatase A-like enzyme